MWSGNQNLGTEDCWKQTSFSLKLFLISSTIIFIVSLLIPALTVLFIDVPAYTIWSLQIWRLLFAMYGQIPGIMSIFSIAFAFLWMYPMLKDDECSTVYKIIEVIIINLEIHIVFNLISLVFTLLFETSQSTLFVAFGWFPIIIIYQFRASMINPEAQRRFCCLPFLIKSKYFPWVILLLMTIFTTQFFCFFASGIVAYYQEVMRKQMIIKLPIKFYRKLQSWLPLSVINRTDFVPIDRVINNLQFFCSKNCGSEFPDRNSSTDEQIAQENSNPLPQSNNNFTSFSSTGQAIGGSSSSTAKDFRSYWANKNEQSTKQVRIVRTVKTEQIEIEPTSSYSNQNLQKANNEDSYAVLNDNNLSTQKLLTGNENSNKNKNEKGENNLI